MRRLEVWRSQSFASWWFFLYAVSPASLQDFTLGGMLSASFPLAAILEFSSQSILFILILMALCAALFSMSKCFVPFILVI
jgi:hypothetical protein